MTFDQALRRELERFEETITLKSFEPVLGACRLEPTAPWKEWRYGKLVEPDED